MRCKIEPDRYADTGFSVRDTPPEINRRIFAHTMSLTPDERLRMGCSMFETARRMIFDSLPPGLSHAERRRAWFERMYGLPCPDAVAEHRG